MILLIDNYDSFTWNLYQYFCELGAEVVVRRNDDVTLADIATLAPQKIVISPGPCTPSESGVSLDVIRHYAGKLPILGVCLGHQAICQCYGATVSYAKELVHGKAYDVEVDTESPLFRGMKSPIKAARYHSLAAVESTMPPCLKITARTSDGEIMAVEHRDYPTYGLQFHPESIMTPEGGKILENFFTMAEKGRK